MVELDKDRKILERMKRELLVIQSPISEDEIDTLTKEIETLRNDCKQMAQEVDEAGLSYGNYFYLFTTFLNKSKINSKYFLALGETNETMYKLKPHRPAPPIPHEIENRSSNQPSISTTLFDMQSQS